MGELPSWPVLAETVAADVCVVGLGGSGLSAIGDALRRGLSVVGVDADRLAAGAAGRNGGFLLAGPAHMVHRAAESWGPADALGLYRATLDELADLEATLGPDVIRRVGSVRLAGLPGEPETSDEEAQRMQELADCLQQQQFLALHGLAVETYDGPIGPGLYLPDDAAMNPVRRAYGLAARYAPSARLFEHSRVTDITPGRIVTHEGAVNAGVVIVAVDGGLENVLPQLVGRVRSARLQMLATGPLDTTPLPCPVYANWGYHYAQQDDAGRLFVGGGRDKFVHSEWGTDARPTEQVQGHIESVAARFAGRPVPITHRWGASVGYTQDGRALVIEVLPGVIACGGYSGTGNLVGPVAARAALALGIDGIAPPSYFLSR